jgi:hypothetical protein
VPVRFRIPHDLPASDRARWALHVVFTLPNGEKYGGDFVVPVYETKDAPPEEQRPEDVAIDENRPGEHAALKLR